MVFSAQDVDRIVAQVLAQLHPVAAAPRTEQAAEVSKGTHATIPGVPEEVLSFDQAVITADVLLERLTGHRRIRVRPNAILTPTARDVLRVRQIECVRDESSSAEVTRGRWLAISSRTSPAASSVIEQLKAAGEAWEHRLSGTGPEATRQAVNALCTADAAGVVLLTGEPELAACRANRNANVRAAVASTVESIHRVRRSLQPNCLVIDPANKSFFELRNLLKAFTQSVPVAPAGWDHSET